MQPQPLHTRRAFSCQLRCRVGVRPRRVENTYAESERANNEGIQFFSQWCRSLPRRQLLLTITWRLTLWLCPDTVGNRACWLPREEKRRGEGVSRLLLLLKKIVKTKRGTEKTSSVESHTGAERTIAKGKGAWGGQDREAFSCLHFGVEGHFVYSTYVSTLGIDSP